MCIVIVFGKINKGMSQLDFLVSPDGNSNAAILFKVAPQKRHVCGNTGELCCWYRGDFCCWCWSCCWWHSWCPGLLFPCDCWLLFCPEQVLRQQHLPWASLPLPPSSFLYLTRLFWNHILTCNTSIKLYFRIQNRQT